MSTSIRTHISTLIHTLSSAGEPVHTRELASRFDVSVRTISRDLAALHAAGWPVWRCGR
jgi:predicted DNA-binding transcriptional regulator YafY